MNSYAQEDLPENAEIGKCYQKTYRSSNCWKNESYSTDSTDWYEVICESDFTEQLVIKIENKLLKLGYLKSEDCDGKFDYTFKRALEKFQQDQNIYGCNDIKTNTLQELGITF